MSEIHISKLPRLCDFKIEIFVTSKYNLESDALREAARLLLGEAIRYESRNH